MSSVLMCKNREVFDVDSERVISFELLPGYMVDNPCRGSFIKWLKLRYSSQTNSIARKLKGVEFGQGNRVVIDKKTYALSLSDCYWIKDSEDDVRFEEISPYYNSFWLGEGKYEGGSIPTLYVGGALTKEWLNAFELKKYGDNSEAEMLSIELCKLCGIHCNDGYLVEGGIIVRNISSPSIMLEQVDASGKLDEDYYTDFDIVSLFGIQGVQMLTVDAIVGNGDRHLGNIAYIRNTDTGEYLGMSPLYDFDHALDTKGFWDRLMNDLCDVIKNKEDYTKEVLRIVNIAINSDLHSVFTSRARSLLQSLSN